MHANIFSLKNESGHEFVAYENVTHLDACGSYTNIYCRGRKEFFHESYNLKHFWLLAKPSGLFVHIHKSCVANLRDIARQEGHSIFLKDGTMLPISRSGRKSLKQILSGRRPSAHKIKQLQAK